MELREIGWEGVDWIHVTQDRDRWRTPVKTVMELRVPQKAGNFLTSLVTRSFTRGTVLHGVHFASLYSVFHISVR